jgi:hypothetical protein
MLKLSLYEIKKNEYILCAAEKKVINIRPIKQELMDTRHFHLTEEIYFISDNNLFNCSPVGVIHVI